ncbi:MAG: ABC transporter ATP-binding protein [Planctomycetota bacterium]|jgi:peptide/nickel transport system ATP-binding protein/oligopeptide transport system ATP-binding protein|nr:ABC transporter ATP-binding protein [Planctomycetota bacterium]MDP6990224.1 ABC transporter ATP-binding protein [Planctomycetota bacterium]
MSEPVNPGNGTRTPLLELRDLRTHFHVEEGVARAVDGVSYTLYEGETLGVVGESGCGKSVTALSVMRLVPMPPGRHEGGQILFQGEDLCRKTDEEIRDLRGNEIAMIFQEPMTALNPVYTVGNQIMETVMLHQGLDAAAAREHAIQMLERVGIPDPASRIDEYPHQLSGGMRQRVMIAIAMACDPALLIADEPTTALDVTIQAQILDLISELQESAQMSVLLITHDLGVVAQTAHHVAVMYAGKVVEYATVEELFAVPKHPYSIGLFHSLPDLAPPGQRLATIPGIVPSATHFPSGCRFRTRCSIASERCVREEPALAPLVEGSPHTVACHHLEEAEKL